MEKFDKIIIGSGFYGLYSALFCGKKGDNVLVIEYDDSSFKRASYINQARVHMGYHYPRSYSTAIKSSSYFKRFNDDYGFCILDSFDKIYATSKNFTWTNAKQFKNFCKSTNIICDEVFTNEYFNEGMCDGAFLTKEYTYDAQILKNFFLDEIKKYPNIQIRYKQKINDVKIINENYLINLESNVIVQSGFILNASYASVNQILDVFKFEKFKIKYELCEVIICKVNDELRNKGFTIMDGPFFSIMPFGKTGFHSLTSVSDTPHKTCKDLLPKFDCQDKSKGFCSSKQLGNCNDCNVKPETSWFYMKNLASKYLKSKFSFEYSHSLFSVKPILMNSEINDSRPTVLRQFSSKPFFYSVLSGKINTVYDLDEILK